MTTLIEQIDRTETMPYCIEITSKMQTELRKYEPDHISFRIRNNSRSSSWLPYPYVMADSDYTIAAYISASGKDYGKEPLLYCFYQNESGKHAVFVTYMYENGDEMQILHTDDPDLAIMFKLKFA